MKNHKIKKVKLDTTVSQNLNESVLLGSSIFLGIYVLWSFVLPYLYLFIFNHIGSFLKNSHKDIKLTKVIQDITNYPVEVYILHDTKTLNAFHSGTKKIYITEGLMSYLTNKEIISVLLHECGHYANIDLKKNIFLIEPIFKFIFLLEMVVFFIFPPVLLFVILITSLSEQTLLSLRKQRNEFLADSFASEHGYGKELISALEKIRILIKKDFCKNIKDNTLCEIQLHRAYSKIPYKSHPDTWQRKLNIKSDDLKYTKKVFKDMKIQYVKKSYFELKRIFNKLNDEIKKEEERLNIKYSDYIRKVLSKQNKEVIDNTNNKE